MWQVRPRTGVCWSQGMAVQGPDPLGLRVWGSVIAPHLGVGWHINRPSVVGLVGGCVSRWFDVSVGMSQLCGTIADP